MILGALATPTAREPSDQCAANPGVATVTPLLVMVCDDASNTKSYSLDLPGSH